MDGFEEQVFVTLYEIEARGHSVRHDTPVMGAEEPYGHWTEHRGYFRRKENARTEYARIIASYLEKGYGESKYSPRSSADSICTHLMDSSKDAYVSLNRLQVRKSEIEEQLDGSCLYKMKPII